MNYFLKEFCSESHRRLLRVRSMQQSSNNQLLSPETIFSLSRNLLNSQVKLQWFSLCAWTLCSRSYITGLRLSPVHHSRQHFERVLSALECNAWSAEIVQPLLSFLTMSMIRIFIGLINWTPRSSFPLRSINAFEFCIWLATCLQWSQRRRYFSVNGGAWNVFFVYSSS